MKLLKACLVISLIILPRLTFAGSENEHTLTAKSSPEFLKIKSLAGRWVGTTDMGSGDQEVAVKYRVTSNGSAVVETLFPETPHEMVSVYYDLNGQLAMTHYCTLGNQPQMELKSSSGNIINLEFSGNNSIDPTKDNHMHSLTIAFLSDDSISQTWTSYQPGSGIQSHIFNFQRLK